MRASEPPVLAKWILENVRFENSSDALAGDLIETFRSQSRSTGWYWRQVLAALSAGFLGELRNHWVLAVRAVAIGLEVGYLAQTLGHEVFFHLHQRLGPVINPYLAWTAVSVLCGVMGAWTVGLSHRKHRNTMLLVFVGALFVWESIARFYISPFHIETHLPFVLLFYPSALFGIFIGGFILTFGSGSKRRRPHVR